MITRITSRTKSTGDTTTLVADDRPAELDSAPHDPDSMTAWMAEGNCRLYPPATFFPSDGVGVDRARKICRDYPVQERCLEYALEERIDQMIEDKTALAEQIIGAGDDWLTEMSTSQLREVLQLNPSALEFES